jgi:flagella basal body P-ring formation protein FlgA
MRSAPFVLLAALSVLATSCACSAQAATLEVVLRSHVTVSGPAVSLGDVAQLRSDDLGLIRMFDALALGHSPRTGGASTVSRDTLMRWVRARAGTADARISWGGAAEVTIARAGASLAGAAVEESARLALGGWLKQRSTRFSMDAVVAPRDLDLPAGKQELRVRPLPVGSAVTARQRVWVDVFVDGAFSRAVPVDFAVAAYGPSWITPAGVARGASVSAGSFEAREINLAQIPAGAVPLQLAAETTVRARRTLAAGGAVTGHDVELLPAVARGEPVVLVSRDRGIELELQAEALQDGHVGQVVRVRARGLVQAVLAQVVAPGRVRIRP